MLTGLRQLQGKAVVVVVVVRAVSKILVIGVVCLRDGVDAHQLEVAHFANTV